MPTASRQTTWSSGQTLTAAALNGEFNHVITVLNDIDENNIDQTANYTWSGTNSWSGASTYTNTLTVGQNDAGHDVKFFGAPDGAYMLWDEDVDDLKLVGAAGLIVPDGQLTLGSTAVTATGAEINLIDGGTARGTTAVASGDGILINDAGTMRMTNVDTVSTYFASQTQTLSGAKTFSAAAQFNNTVTVGVDNTGYDVKFFGDASGKSWLWDESADKMIVTGDASVSGVTTLTGVTTHGGNVVSDTDSTDDLGTTSVRWANLYVDSIGDTGQTLAVAGSVNFDSNTLFVDHSSNEVGIGTASPSTFLDVQGDKGSTDTGWNDAAKIRPGDVNTGQLIIRGQGGGSNANRNVSLNAYGEGGSGYTDLILQDGGGDVGIGVVPESTWSSSYTALQVAGVGALWGPTAASAGAKGELSANLYHTGSASKYIIADEASRYYQINGSHNFEVAGAGSADGTISFTSGMTVDSSGNVGLGTGSPSGKLDVESAAATTDIIINNTATTGDPTLQWQLSGTTKYMLAVDDDDEDRLVMVAGTSIPGNQMFGWDANKNFGIGGHGDWGVNGVGVLSIKNGTAPVSSPANVVQLYAQDVSSSSELKVRDEAGNITTLSPHNFEGVPGGPSEDLAWAYCSERDGRRISVDMLKLARTIERLSGETLVHITEGN